MLRSILVALVAALAIAGCGSSAPADHTVDRGGVRHKSGLDAPLMSDCVNCHGSSLQGDKGPSCTSCHKKKW